MPFEQAGTVKDQRERKRHRPQGGAPPFAITRTFAASPLFAFLTRRGPSSTFDFQVWIAEWDQRGAIGQADGAQSQGAEGCQKPGFYGDGGSLYLQISHYGGSASWRSDIEIV
jgi:hypothetical protein